MHHLATTSPPLPRPGSADGELVGLLGVVRVLFDGGGQLFHLEAVSPGKMPALVTLRQSLLPAAISFEPVLMHPTDS